MPLVQLLSPCSCVYNPEAVLCLYFDTFLIKIHIYWFLCQFYSGLTYVYTCDLQFNCDPLWIIYMHDSDSDMVSIYVFVTVCLYSDKCAHLVFLLQPLYLTLIPSCSYIWPCRNHNLILDQPVCMVQLSYYFVNI